MTVLKKIILIQESIRRHWLNFYNVDGKQYAIPKDFDTIGVWYNKKIFDEAGVPYPTDDWTWDDMADIAKQLTR